MAAAGILAVACAVLAVVSRARLAAPLRRPRSWAEVAPAAAVLALALLLQARPTEYLVGGRDPGAYVAALESLSDDPLRREELVEGGRARARTFTWQRTAEQTADVYRSLL